MKKQLMAVGVASMIGVAGIGAGVANAATSNSETDNGPMSGLVSAIATKFNLDKSQVQQVFDEQRSTMEKQRDEEVKTELQKLVTDGKITQAQMDAIIAKRAEIQKDREANKDNFKNLTETERKAKMDEKKAALDAWAKEQGISSDYLKYVMGGGRGHGPGGHRFDKNQNDLAAPDSSTSNQ